MQKLSVIAARLIAPQFCQKRQREHLAVAAGGGAVGG
jgi:hypothetical protein